MQLPPALPLGPAQLARGAACAARRVRRRAAPSAARSSAGAAPTPEAYRAAAVAIKEVVDLELLRQQARPPPPPSRTKWTRLVHPSVLIGHVSSTHGAASFTPRPRGPAPRRAAVCGLTPPSWPSPRTDWTRLVRLPVLTGHVSAAHAGTSSSKSKVRAHPPSPTLPRLAPWSRRARGWRSTALLSPTASRRRPDGFYGSRNRSRPVCANP